MRYRMADYPAPLHAPPPKKEPFSEANQVTLAVHALWLRNRGVGCSHTRSLILYTRALPVANPSIRTAQPAAPLRLLALYPEARALRIPFL